jgi:sugar/nucleoside kinase (ribokinase family)
VGGTGYNLAINLSQAGIPVGFLTVLKEHSFSSVWIRERLEGAGVHTDLIQLSDHIIESGFVGIRCDGHLQTAVTATAVGEYVFRADVLEEAVRHARLVVFDCNLAVDQMALIIEYGTRYNRPVAVAGVSDTKVVRLLDLGQHKPFDLVVLNDIEAKAVLSHESHSQLDHACVELQAEHVIVTSGPNGYTVISKGGAPKHYRAPQVERIESRTGAGDALLAGIVAHWYRHRRLDFDEAVPSIALFVRKVLQQPGATVGSLATDVDFGLLARIAVRNGPLWKRMLSPEMGVAAGIVVTILTVVILIFTYELLPRDLHSGTGSATSSQPTDAPRDSIKAAPEVRH